MRIPYKSLTFWIFFGWFAGIGAGWLMGDAIVPLAGTLSNLFLKLLRMTIMPLIIASITSGVISVGDRSNLGILGAKTFGYYMMTSLIAILTGQVLVNIFKPGVGSTIQLDETPDKIAAVEQSFSEILYGLIPENPFQAMADGQVLPMIFFCILLGYFITRLDAGHKQTLSSLINGFFDVMMKMVGFIIWSAPIGVFGINAKIVATTGFESFVSLGYYFVVVVVGLGIHAFLTLPLLMRLLTRKNPFHHFMGMASPMIMAFSTSSSVVTLPLTMKAVTENSKVSKKIASFVLPIGATVNMDGTALYECVAVVFIAQVYGFELTLTSQLLIVATALLASIGAAGVPMAGLVMLSIILRAVGLPLEGAAIILAVDRVLDMFRTTVNVLSDSFGAVILAKLEGESVLER